MFINPESCLFLKEDLDLLDERISRLQRLLATHGKIIGASCQESSEASHDNFPWEQATKDHAAVLGMLNEYKAIRKHARLVCPSRQTAIIEIGNAVTYQDESTGETDSLVIGSFRVFDDSGEGDRASYESPIAQAFLGLSKGDTTTSIQIGDRKKVFTILQIM